MATSPTFLQIKDELILEGWVGKRMENNTSGFQKFWLLLWKNWLLQRRRKIQSVIEVVLPIVFCILLVVIRDLAPSENFPEPTHYKPFDINELPANLTPSKAGIFESFTEAFLEDFTKRKRSISLESESEISSLQSSFHKQPGHPFPTRDIPKLSSARHRKKRSYWFFDIFNPAWPLAYSPNNTVVNELMQIVADLLFVDVESYGFRTEQEMVDRLITTTKKENSSLEEESVELEDVLGGIVFTCDFPNNNTLPEKISYKIRLKGALRSGKKRNPFVPPPQWLTEIKYPLFQVPGPRDRTKERGGRPGYYDEGFLTLQYAVDTAIIRLLSGKDTREFLSLKMQRMPYPPFIDDKYLVALQSWMPFVLLASYIYPAINIVKSVVYEKEKRLKESMKMMGLQNWLHWSAWFIKSFIFLAMSTILITILLCVKWQGSSSLAVLNNSDPSLVLVFLLLFATCSIVSCFFLSAFFSKANSAATAAGLVWFFTYFPYMVLRSRYSTLTLSNKLVLSLLPNTAMSLGCQITSMFEGIGSGIQWHLFFTGVSPDDHFTLSHVFGMLILDTIILALLTWYIEAVWPGEYGVPQPWYFPFMGSYWKGQPLTRNEKHTIISTTQDHHFFEAEPKGLSVGVKITGLTKVFRRGHKVAVNDVYLNMYDGQITVLLGHNGAGKTTLMSMLTGLFPPTSGTAKVGGYDIVTEMENVRSSLGLCPQHDVLFDELTVAEHIIFFSRLKGFPSEKAKSEVSHMVKKLKLEEKVDSMAKTLSGGMKRKLSVGIALCAGSHVVFLDEPTSGMDPGARRLIWDLLQEERAGRTILLTTHFMEEADLLGDRIAIMANGVIQCCGSSLFLKKNYGTGYRLIIVKEKNCNVGAITDVIRSHIPDAELDQNVGAELSYVLPNADVSNFEALFLQIEKQKQALKISSFGASQTTMDEVFVRVGEAVDLENFSLLHKKLHHGEYNKTANLAENHQENGLLMHQSTNNSIEEIQMTPTENGAKDIAVRGFDTSPRRVPLQRNTGCYLILQQFWAMVVKKVLYTCRNIRLTIAQNIIPVAFLILALLVIETIPGVNDSPPKVTFTSKNFDGTSTMLQVQNPNNLTGLLVKALDSSIKSPDKIQNIEPSITFSTALLNQAEKDLPTFNLHWMVGIQLVGDDLGGTATVFFNDQPFHNPPYALTTMTNALARAITGNPKVQITTSNHPLPRTDYDKLTQDMRQNIGFQIGFNLAFGMSFLAASFVIFLVQERSTKAKHLQFVSGVNFVTYWAASAIWDYIIFMIPCCLCLLCLFAFNLDGLNGDQLGKIMIVFIFYAWVTLPLMYLCSFLFNIPASSFTKMIIINIITGMATLITVNILRIPDLELRDVAEYLDWVFLLFPSYALAAAFTDLYSNWRFTGICKREIFSLLCGLKAFPNPCCKTAENCGNYGCVNWNENFVAWESLGIGRMLVFMALEGIVGYIIIALIEMKVFQEIQYSLTRLWHKATVGKVVDIEGSADKLTPEDEDVKAERLRIQNSTVEQLCITDKLILQHLCKTYSGNFMAVDHLNLGVPLGECFGLLGINGAGKTTTFKMLTGDLQVSLGDAYVNGYSIKSDLKKVQQQIGYCPQFDALLDQMTGRETLRMFARLRGVPEKQIDEVISSLAEQLLVTQHLENLCGNYSGGNKRKLSTGVALVGDPPLVLLDEPTSGMDPVARRLLWDVLTNVRDAGRSIILTSHSMEECEALCTRLAIMVNGKFCCLGSPQHLKSKFSEGFSIIIRVQITDGFSTRNGHLSEMPPEMFKVKHFIESKFPRNQLREMQWGRFEYFVPSEGLTWSYVFGMLERNRVELAIDDYSVTQTTLERVFLSFTRGQRPEQDGT
ncbi:phospholipid-transporting ATPase ABCA3-like isoform X1 [Palaemon carinicauda]|uniref:phospholipid-transporting ATPase ABCA3-like isoform X1 n=2 Tax=Palaemon carinicauda TaxID=392227 RepID=UPI0035B6A492